MAVDVEDARPIVAGLLDDMEVPDLVVEGPLALFVPWGETAGGRRAVTPNVR